MSFNVNLTITGIQQAQRANQTMIQSLRPISTLGQALKYGIVTALRYAVAITHVDTGSLRASHRGEIEGDGTRARIYIDPSAVNPRSHQLTSVYGIYEHNRGGGHAFYARTAQEAGPLIVQRMYQIIRNDWP